VLLFIFLRVIFLASKSKIVCKNMFPIIEREKKHRESSITIMVAHLEKILKLLFFKMFFFKNLLNYFLKKYFFILIYYLKL